MTNFVKSYFDRHKYAAQPSAYQSRVLAVLVQILDCLEYESLFEVGPGQGFALALVPDDKLIAVSDLTLNTLLPLPYPAIEGLLGSLPLKDRAFDIAMAFDVIEHIPENVLLEAVGELFRISSKYVLLGVPAFEDVIAKLTKCPKCNEVFHINHHWRRYCPQQLFDYCPVGWKVSALVYTGTRRPLSHPDLSVERCRQGVWKKYDRTNCPSCGCAGPFGADNPTDTNGLDMKQFAGHKEMRQCHEEWLIPSSEMIAVFTRADNELPSLTSRPFSNALAEARKIPISSIDLGRAEVYGDKYLRKMRTRPHFQFPTSDFRSSGKQLEIDLQEGKPDRIVLCFPGRGFWDGPSGFRLHGSIKGKLRMSLHDQTTEGKALADAVYEDQNFLFNIPVSLKQDPMRGYVIRIALAGSGQLQLGIAQLEPVEPVDLHILEEDANVLLHVDARPPVYYQFPEADARQHVLPLALRDDPMMQSDREDWAAYWRQLRKDAHVTQIPEKTVRSDQAVAEMGESGDSVRDLPDWLVERMVRTETGQNLNFSDGMIRLSDGSPIYPVDFGIVRALPPKGK